MGLSSSLVVLPLIVLFLILTQVSSDVEIDQDESTQSQTQLVKGGGANRRLLPFLDCEGLCKGRCSLHSRPNVCTRACGTCCLRCKCVPPGTSGNRQLCGTCYTDMTTHSNKTKCP
ncbi:Gibberellin-regulated family protein [Euphorbia peplus]|nr:Gibberellin-regulated family protein [Euphorbia peplus]